MSTLRPGSIRTPRRSTPVAQDAPRKPRRVKAPKQPGYGRKGSTGFIRYGLLASACLGLAYGGWWLWDSDELTGGVARLGAGLGTAAQSEDLVLAQIHVTGLHNLKAETVIKASGISLGDPVMSADLSDIRERIVSLGWVESAVVSRRLPGSLKIAIREREPFALWQFAGRLRLIDRSGAEITQRRLERFARLPLVVGAGAAKHADDLLKVLTTQQALAGRVQAAVRIGNRRWDLHFENGVDVRLPEKGIEKAWQRFIGLEQKSRILARDVDVVDLRLPDRIAVRRASQSNAGS